MRVNLVNVDLFVGVASRCKHPARSALIARMNESVNGTVIA